ncbi:hypothetical protein GCM10010172_80190 [Paractinoplanes ferrugineus]|uniref:Uncharacterized protein n=1 Tax=Paractinoplanes ferrugineus TaxID=113564 RepID=A0A919J8Z5_9ACTN|nr:hypothetical protein [Actinoplanes ferrugineus]GIE16735.1 hypothetical protein Afe05nite_85750 [Actinoplanes ferrugineus]
MTYSAHHDLSMHNIPARPGDPLLVGDQAVVDVIVKVAYNACRQMGSTHNAAPCAQALSERIYHPKPGDPVYVPDSLRQDEDGRRKGVGYLVVARTEWWHSDEDWLAPNPDDPWGSSFAQWTLDEPLVWDPLTHPKRPKEDVFYVQYGPDPGDICRWENASCYALPLGGDMMRELAEAARVIVLAERGNAWAH